MKMYQQEPLPFYKTYPLEPFLTESKWMEVEKEKMLSYIPKEYQMIQKKVEDICDKWEYDGSRMYDEHLDMHVIRKMSEKLVPEMKEEKERKYWIDIANCFLCNEMLYRRYRKRRGKPYINLRF